MIETIVIIYAMVLGLLFGSFANVVIYRLPKGESIAKPPSKCPACNRRLGILDLIPLLSWFILHARCRYCGKRISVRYPIIEAVCSMLFTCMVAYSGANLSVLPLCMLTFVLLCISCIDIDIQEIPDSLLILGTALGAVWIVVAQILPQTINAGNAPNLQNAFLGVLAGAAPLFIIDRISIIFTGMDGFGFGDVKLMAMAGIFLGWKLTLVSLLFAVMAGGLFGAFLIISRKAEKGTYIAFAPFLSLGILLSLWFGEPFLKLLFWNF